MKRFLLYFLFVVCSCQLSAQFYKGIAVYAHTNQQLYRAGETVFAKLYIMEADTLMVQPVNIYADWYNASGNLIQHQIFLSKLGGAEASFTIPAQYPADFVRLRLYTLASLEQTIQPAYSDQVIFIKRKKSEIKLSDIDTVQNNLIGAPHNYNSKELAALDSGIQIKMIEKNLGKKGRNEWVIENNGKVFINLSVAVVEEESNVITPFNILTQLGAEYRSKRVNIVGAPTSPKSSIYNDAYIQLKGIVKSETDLTKEGLQLIYSIFRRGQMPEIRQSPIADDGSFLINNLLFYDSAKITFQLNRKAKRSKKFGIAYTQLGLFKDAPLFQSNWEWMHPKLKVDDLSNLNAYYVSTDINEVVVHTKVKSEKNLLEDKYTSGLFKGGDAFEFNMLKPNSRSFPTVFHYLQGKVPGLQIVFQSSMAASAIDTTVFSGKREESNGIFGVPKFYWRSSQDEIKFFLNQIPTDANSIMSLLMNEIAYVKVFRPPFLGAALGAPNGAIAIYTKVGDEIELEPSYSKYGGYMVLGYTSVVPYFQPDYSTEKKRDVLDTRKSLGWFPTIYLNHQQKTQGFVYYNNDKSKKHRIIVEGVMHNGKIVRKEWVVE